MQHVKQDRFPAIFCDHVHKHEQRLFDRFMALLGNDADDVVRARLWDFMQGQGEADGLRTRLTKALEELVEERKTYKKRKDELDKTKAKAQQKPQDEATQHEIDGLLRERDKMRELIKEMNGRELLANVMLATAEEVVGEVVGQPPSMMTGYHRQPEKTREAEWFDAAGKRFIRTGDVGRFDADGFLILLDRRKDLIISGGFNLYPSDLEAVLCGHPAVADAAVVGVPSAEWGEAPIGFVVRRSDPVEELADAPDEAGLRDWANARLGRMQRLASIEFVDELPRSAIGKVLKRSLRDDWVARRGAMAGARDTREIRWRPDPAAISSRGDQIR